MVRDGHAPPPHRIGRVEFDVTGPDQAALMALSSRIAAASYGSLAAALGRSLDGATAPDEVLVIERLTVDLGSLPANALDLETLERATRRAIGEAAARSEPTARATGRDVASHGAHAIAGQADRANAPTRERLGDVAITAYLAYLRTGTLLPLTIPATLPDLAAALDVAVAAPRLRALLVALPRAARAAAILRVLTSLPAAPARRLLSIALPEMTETTVQVLRAADERTPTEAALAKIARRIAHDIATLSHAAEAEADAADAPAEDRRASAPRADTPAPNAGACLLHPFLRPTFEDLGLVSGRAFSGPDAQVTAARVLHYAATGNDAAPEPDLVVPRLFCAVPPSVPILPLDPLPDALRARADAIVDALVDRWEGIGHATRDGLRASFLTRNGALRDAGTAPHLIVERSGVDILLGRLPFTMSFIALSWLPAPIRVDWA